jgi:signal transduction histidine kinase
MKEIIRRIGDKKVTYQKYNFTQTESAALTTFFDLAQELESIEDFYRLCVSIPKVFFNLDAGIFIIDPKLNKIVLVATTTGDPAQYIFTIDEDIRADESPSYSDYGTILFGLKGNKLLIDQIPERVRNGILGFLEIFPAHKLNNHLEFFLQKYANRIGFNLHNRFLFEKNVEHLKFIRALVADIEHNVIVPNMVFKLFIRRLKAKIDKSREIERFLIKHTSDDACDGLCMEHLYDELRDVNKGLKDEYENIEKHYRNTSLFLETLLRRSHFDHGRLTLRKMRCNMKRDVVQPQLERFIEDFKERNIAIDDRFSGIPDEDVISVIDIGLIAQVYANLFSNAVKYTEEVVNQYGEPKKYIAYGREMVKNYFGEGKNGIKYNVFSTGRHINLEERDKIFTEGYRGSNISFKPGTGHGLSFVKNAVEIHGGVVAYETTPLGNNFYFILPE